MRESGVWTYGVVNLVHILGVASLFGSVLVLDLRLLGCWRSVTLPAISKPTVPIALTGFGCGDEWRLLAGDQGDGIRR